MSAQPASWMRPKPVDAVRSPIPTLYSQTSPFERYRLWPTKQTAGDSSYAILKKTLVEQPGIKCRLARYGQSAPNTCMWEFEDSATTVEKLIETVAPHNRSLCYIVSSLQGDAIRAVGHSMDLPPQLFNIPYVRLRVNASGDYMLCSLQFFQRYEDGQRPTEAQRVETSPRYKFMSRDGDHRHEWHVTCIRVLVLGQHHLDSLVRCNPSGRDPGIRTGPSINRVPEAHRRKHFWALLLIDPKDDEIANRIRDLMIKSDRLAVSETEPYKGLDQVLSDVVYTIIGRWNAFFTEADFHLQIMRERCVDSEPTPAEQLQYTKQLYRLLPVWVEVRRRITAAQDLMTQVIDHPFFRDDPRDRSERERFFRNKVPVLEDHLQRCQEASIQTKVLIDYLSNLATLESSRSAVEETKASNALAGSIRRVTMLTFIYLPLTLASSIFGMNIKQITGEGTHGQLWSYFIVAVSFMIATFGGWYVWSAAWPSLQSQMKRKVQKNVSGSNSIDPDV